MSDEPLLPELDWYRIRTRYPYSLPERMRGVFPYFDAYALCSRWNRHHIAEDMAWPEIVGGEEAREIRFLSEPVRRDLTRITLLEQESAFQHQVVLQADRYLERLLDQWALPTSELAMLTQPTPFRPYEGERKRQARCLRLLRPHRA